MGFGLGLACAAEFRLVTERSLLAMPECVIGITPDVGFAATAALMAPGVGKLEFGEQRFHSRRRSVMIRTVNKNIIVLLGRDFCIDILEVQVHSSLDVR